MGRSSKYSYVIHFLCAVVITFACAKKYPGKHKSLGKMPAIFAEHYDKKSRLVEKKRLTQSIGKTLEIKSELKKLNQKTLKAYEKEYHKLSFPIPLPTEGRKEYNAFKINNAYISDISPSGRLKVTIEGIAKKDNVCVFAFARLKDQNNSTNHERGYLIFTLPTSYQGDVNTNLIKKGGEIYLNGFYNCSKIMSRNTKLQLISKAEFFEE
ncbi:MAG: hypothetical protein R6U19_06450 [Bacteroidales bacterium]